MQFNSASVSSPKRRDLTPTGSRLRRKRKRLDAICENVYNQNHSEPIDARAESPSPSTLDAHSELRRSSRMRRPPVVLDVSPPPVKKRNKHGKSVNLCVNTTGGSNIRAVKKEDSDRLEDLDTLGGWRTRLRSRRRNSSTGERRRKLFGEMNVEGGLNDGKRDNEKLIVVKSKRPGRVKALNGLETEMKEGGTCDDEDVSGKDASKQSIGSDEDVKDESEVGNGASEEMPAVDSTIDCGNESEVMELEADESMPILVTVDERNEAEVVDDGATQSGPDEQEHEETLHSLELERNPDTFENLEKNNSELDTSDTEVEELNAEVDVENERDAEVDHPALMKEMGELEKEGDAKLSDNILKVEKEVKDKTKHDSQDLGRPRIKQGRRCGLCGCSNDSQPPKKLLLNAADSEHETYSGSSASDETNYDMWDGFGDEPGWLGHLLGPINDRYGIAGIWVHQQCAVWSPEVYFAGLGCLKNVRAALCRGRALKCSRCGRAGATIGCRVDRCPKTYHLPCARANGCIFDHRKFLIACTDHRHLFQPQGNQYFMRIKKLKARKIKLEVRKRSNDARRKDVEAEEKWLENCGEDEEFLKRESKRLHRDLLRIAPVYIGGSESDSGKLFEGWESVAGLKDVIQCMKEVVILPLLYPEFFSDLGITPPRGVLLHGYPGTGKTLVVRALIGSCARGDKRIAYFARKGADCLGKYVGDAERQLRLLFQVAEQCQPSVIFFDEIDGLAPTRTRQQDQTHSSVVSTLLALMDGLKSRGSVVVIGATNRPESVDPALRRPGRFDREIYFPLPSVEDRAAILSLHTRRWPKPVTGSMLHQVARRTVGFAGADLQALCTQAAIIALKRNFPLQEVLSAAGERAPGAQRIPLPAFAVEERDWLEALACAPPPCSLREAGIAAHDLVSSPLPAHLIPCLLEPLSKLLVSLYLDERLWLPPPLSKAATVIKSVVVASLEKKNVSSQQWWSYVDLFLRDAEVAGEIQRRLSSAGILTGEASCISADEENDAGFKSEPSFVHNSGMNISVFRNIYCGSRKTSGYRVLIAGSPRSGQRHLASCILNCFIGNVEVQKVDLATISQEGHGDMVQGITQLLMKCASLQSSVIFMPRIDLWAVEACRHITEESDASSTDQQLSKTTESCSTHILDVGKVNEPFTHQRRTSEMPQPQTATPSSSHVWNSFVEQVEYISLSTSLIILATSELSNVELPHKVLHFFKSDISNSSLLTPLEHTIPRFSVPVGENFDHDVVVSLSAAKLTRDIIQFFVLLLHQRAHIHASASEEHKSLYSLQASSDTKYQYNNHGSIQNEKSSEKSKCDGSKVPPPSNNRSLKGKSSLLLAISTFGYQILRYPHFAELCWVSSKLKEGPCADVSGPWKGWSFNTCIIRPTNVDKVAVGCGTGNIKSKDRSGFVRGLIAVGLLAYRGVYQSLKEVTFDVRKVLELLVRQVNEKVQAGKDKYQYVRLLSQVAYLEDVVNSWAHTLQSLELANQVKGGNADHSIKEFSCNCTCADHAVQTEECKGVQLESECQERNFVELAPENVDGVELNKGDNGFCHSSSEVGDAPSEDVTAKQVVFFQSTSDKQLADNITDEQNGNTCGQSGSKSTETLGVSAGIGNGNLKYSNGFPSEAGTSGPSNSCGQSDGLAEMGDEIKNKDAETDQGENVGDINYPVNTTPQTVDSSSGVVCSYNCCSGCLLTLHRLIQKILVHKWGLKNSHWKAEDVHDVVSSLSVDLLSIVRKVDNGENNSNSFDENLKCASPERLSECPEMQNCQCRSSESSLVMATDCGCHNVDGCVAAKANESRNTVFGHEVEFILRDGILVSVESNKDISYHCKYEAVCLCSLIKSVVMMKQSFD
ncbi:uncharacterized protein [Euphorbia lathyris]|uniref:uncharacterized protein n=1 Tax=Euphorbia lathyris TaxID=212925 RepID=UPI0033130E76